MHQALEDLEVYRLAEKIADEIWEIVIQWDSFAKYSIGRQLAEAADSIASNISEGYGRYFYKENIQFCYYARGSLIETQNWIRRAKNRSLPNADKLSKCSDTLVILAKKLNAYIAAIKKKSQSVTQSKNNYPMTDVR